MTKEYQPVPEREQEPLFKLGHIVATLGALDLLEEAEVNPLLLLTRHVTGDWGDLDDEDKKANGEALQYENRIISAYEVRPGQKIWVITEWDRSVTTLLRPEDY